MIYGASLLHAKIAAVCPIDGVAIGDPANAKTWRIDFSPSATAKQIASAQTLLAGITPAMLASAEAAVASAAASLPDPLASAKTSALTAL